VCVCVYVCVCVCVLAMACLTVNQQQHSKQACACVCVCAYVCMCSNHYLSIHTKRTVYNAVVISILLYGAHAKTWTLKVPDMC